MGAPSTAVAPRRFILSAFVTVLVVAVVLRVHALGALSFYYDELYAVRIHGLSLRNLAGVLARTAFYDIHPPFYYLTALGWTALAGTSEASVRLLSALVGLITLPFVYLLGRDLHTRRTGLFAALLLAVYPVHVYYSREARMYALMALGATASTWLLLRLARGDRQRWLLPAWLLATTATALTHYFGVMHVLAEFVVLAWRGRRGVASLPAWLTLFAVPAAVFVPFALFAQYQTKHNEVSYLGSGVGAYIDLLAWLGGAHQRLPLAPLWTLPFLALVVLGVRASWREAPPDPPPCVQPPPPVGLGERAFWVLTALGAAVVAAGVFVLRNKIANRITDIEVARGELESLAILQGRTATVAAFLGALAGGFAALAVAGRDALTARLERRFPTLAGGLDPALSLPRVCLSVVGIPIALSIVAGLAGRPLVLVRNFLCAAPFLALLAARGLASLPRGAMGGALGVFVLISLGVASRFGALPGVPLDHDAVRPWLNHTYYDWRRLEGALGDDVDVPIVTLQHYATDAAIHYRKGHTVVRVRLDGERQLRVSQVRGDDGREGGFRVGQRFDPRGTPRFFFLDMGHALAHAAEASALLRAEVGIHRCALVARIPGGVMVFDCRDNTGLARR
jgi:hypothetical protein